MTCTRWVDGASCGKPGVLFSSGVFCPAHTPAALAGRVVPTPDPDRTAEGLRGRAVSGYLGGKAYGTATDDPLGRTVTCDAAGARSKDRLPRYPCVSCRVEVALAAGHKGPCR